MSENRYMTVTKLISELLKLESEGYGNLPVVDGSNDFVEEAVVTFIGHTDCVQIW